MTASRPLARRATSMPRSAIREVMDLAAGREGVIHLEVGEPDFGTPASIVEQAFEGVRAGATRYTPNAGVPRLRALIAERASARAGVAIPPERIVVTTGAIGALFTSVMLVTDVGDEILIPDPGWPNYESIVHLAGGKPVRYTLSAADGFRPDLDALAGMITPRTKAILLNTPGNPTGAVFGREVMEGFAHLAREHGVHLISDEIYEDILFDGAHVSAASVAPEDRVLLVSGLSKSYAMTGWRVGYILCPPGLEGYAAGLQEPVTSCVSAPSQEAAIAALAGPQDCVGQFRDIYRRRRDVVVDTLAGSGLLPIIPEGAFYALIAIARSGMGSLAFAKRFLVERNVAVVPGITFGPSCDGFVRIAFTTEDALLRTGLERLSAELDGGGRR